MYWRLHKAIFDTRIEEASTLLRLLDDDVQVVDGPLSALPPLADWAGTEGPSLALTTLQDARRHQQANVGAPWLYFHSEHYNCAYWMSRIAPSIPVLNRGGVFVPIGLLGHLPSAVLAQLAGDNGRVFIRPDSGLKSFTGFTVATGEHFVADVADELRFRHPDPEWLGLIAPARTLGPIEWRFWIVNREIVAHSPYAWDGFPEWSAAPEPVMAIARAMAANPWQPDLAYVVDVVTLADGRPMLNEINAASTSGIYDAPIEPLLMALRKAAHHEHAGDWSKGQD